MRSASRSRGKVWEASDPGLQEVLAQIHETAERPRCLCVARGVEMYVARHQRYLVKRMPETGRDHHPSLPSRLNRRACQDWATWWVRRCWNTARPCRASGRLPVGARQRPGDRARSASPRSWRDRGPTAAHVVAGGAALPVRARRVQPLDARDGRAPQQGVLHKYPLEAAQEIEVRARRWLSASLRAGALQRSREGRHRPPPP